MHPNKKRLRRSMMFLNCQKPGLIKDPYIYKPDSIMLDLEDAVAENQKDAARYSLYHALQEIDYRGVERVVRINVLIPRTGKRISVSVLPEVLIRSVSQRPRQHRMLRLLRNMSLRQRKSLDARREARS